jgi:hypothetical protein
MKGKVCTPQQPDRTESFLGGASIEIVDRDFVGTREIRDDKPRFGLHAAAV